MLDAEALEALLTLLAALLGDLLLGDFDDTLDDELDRDELDEHGDRSVLIVTCTSPQSPITLKNRMLIAGSQVLPGWAMYVVTVPNESVTINSHPCGPVPTQMSCQVKPQPNPM